MRLSDLRYLAAYIVPILVYLGVMQGGILTYGAVIFAFIIVPLAEPFLTQSTNNLDEETRLKKADSLFFEFLLYLNIPVVFYLLFLLSTRVTDGIYTTNELTGLLLSNGALLASCGINVAHELGHKDEWWGRYSSVFLLIPCHYTHFHLEHNLGHHKNVATDKDPATARRNEILYAFWIRSVVGSYVNAWKLESKRLGQENKSVLRLDNRMIIYTFLHLIYISALFIFFSTTAALIIIASGIVSFLFLETINYVEHYGLFRKRLDSGRYERVQPWHSWNSNHHLGRIILYELTRHSDHHFLANKKYQLLEHHQSSPQLPYGYPTSMLISMVPPLWFKIMNPRLEEFSVSSA